MHLVGGVYGFQLMLEQMIERKTYFCVISVLFLLQLKLLITEALFFTLNIFKLP